jgi:outer membrane immunogenic protein
MSRLSAPLIASSVFAFIQVASAADLPRKAPAAPPPIQAYSWTGFYIGGNVGGGGNRRDVNFVGVDPAAQALLQGSFELPNGSFNTIGGLGGVQAGYNWQLNPNWLIGIEADFDWSGIKGSGNLLGVGILSPTASLQERINWFGTVRARLGYLPVENFLAYVTGGFAYGKIEHSAILNSGSTGLSVIINNNGFGVLCGAAQPTCFAGSSSETAIGWTVGAGFEYAVWRNVSVKAEYLYVNLDADPLLATALNSGGIATPATVSVNFDRTDFHVARVGVNYRF